MLYEALLGEESGVEQDYDFLNGHDQLVLIRDTLQASLSQLNACFGSNIDDW